MDNLNEPRRMELAPESINDLNTTRKWTMFLAILGFIWLGFMAVALIGIGAFMPMLGDASALGGLETGLIMIVFVVMVVLYIFPILYMYRFSSHMKKALELQQQEELTLSLSNLKSFFKFIGILTIVMILLYILILIGSLTAALFTAF